MTTTYKPGELVRTGSHHIGTGHSGEPVKEEVYLYFLTEWRGQSAIVTMRLDRYSHAVWNNETNTKEPDRFSPWRCVASEARAKTDEPHGYGAHLTDTARRRLGEVHTDPALDWLGSDDYRRSVRSAALSAIWRAASDGAWRYSDPASRDVDRIYRHLRQLLTEADAEDVGAISAALNGLRSALDRVNHPDEVADVDEEIGSATIAERSALGWPLT
jgi:hypothetical protein